ncbi:MAG: endonuclease/exonuclease/phosphatase family protein [Thermoproteota archaeon]
MKIKVCTWNLHAGLDSDFKPKFQESIALMKTIKPDLIGLQECTKGKHSWSQDFGFMGEILSEELNMDFFWSPTISDTFGNLVLVRKDIKIEKVKDVQLPWKPIRSISHAIKRVLSLKVPLSEKRHAILMYLNLNGFRFKFINTHLGLSKDERIKQIKKLIEICLWDSLPTLLVGDFNEPISDEAVKMLLNNLNEVSNVYTEHNLYTFPSNHPTTKIDHIFFSGYFKLVNLEIISSSSSDHLPLVATFEVTT